MRPSLKDLSRLHVLLVVMAFAVASGMGCSDDEAASSGGETSDTDTGLTQTGSDAAGGDSGVGTTDDSTADDTSTAVDSALPGDPAITGGVTVYQTRAPQVEALETGGLGAGFRLPSAPQSVPPVAEVGECVINPVDPNALLFPDAPSLDAGDITVTLGPEQFTLTLTETEDGQVYRSDAPEDRIEYFSGGLTIQFAGEGGADVSAFSGSVSAPAPPTISAPAWTGTSGGTHMASQPLSISWVATTSADAIVSVVPIQVLPEPGIAEGNGITCIVPGSGNYEIPAEALSYLPEPGIFGPSVAVTVIVPVSETMRVGDTEVILNITGSHTVVGRVE